ncbi:hypothetical protein ACTJKH_11375 [Microbacterium sp. 22215]|uniref:hypothetical protein n=1 Tax=Microbacterium sp. 22215 TaxID=3453893 RepID=UPI003F8485C3
MRDLPLSASYMSADDVLQDLLSFHATPDRTTAPIAIPHLPPFAASPRRAEPAV